MFGQILAKQGQKLLENSFYALACICFFALLPLSCWLSVAIVALITLRQGWQNGLQATLVGITALIGLLAFSKPMPAAISEAILTFLPCYIAACLLRYTINWKVVVLAMVMLFSLGLLSVHLWAQPLIMKQYHAMQWLVQNLEQGNAVWKLWLSNQSDASSQVFAYYWLGAQALSIFSNALISLAFARAIQSRLFYPGGFKQEMLAFRANSVSLGLFIPLVVATYYHNFLAISCLPIMVFYYMLAGISLSFNLWRVEKRYIALLLLILIGIFMPFVAIPLYLVCGILDSLFNFREYLPSVASKKI